MLIIHKKLAYELLGIASIEPEQVQRQGCPHLMQRSHVALRIDFVESLVS